jgi:hypothetical protein
MSPNALWYKTNAAFFQCIKVPQMLCYFTNIPKHAKENNHPMGENSPNLVTLTVCIILASFVILIGSSVAILGEFSPIV